VFDDAHRDETRIVRNTHFASPRNASNADTQKYAANPVSFFGKHAFDRGKKIVAVSWSRSGINLCST
jgi:hypothetical protein